MTRLRSPRSQRAIKLLTLSLSLTLGLVAAELVLWCFPGLMPAQLRDRDYTVNESRYADHPHIGHIQTPNSSGVITRRQDFSELHRIDSSGFRNGETSSDTAGVIVIGDSLVFGYGAGDDGSWPAILNRESDEVVRNLGLIGAGPQQYLRIYESVGKKLQPGRVIVGLFLRNDFWDALLYESWLRSGSTDNYMVWRDIGRRSGPAGVLGALQRYSRLCELAVFAIKRRRNHGPQVTHRLSESSDVVLYPRDFRSKTRGHRAGERAFELVLDSLLRLKDEAEQRGAEVLFVLQPSKEEVHCPLVGTSVPAISQPLVEAFEERGVQYLDLTGSFMAATEAGRQLFFRIDGHPNPDGYRLIAEEVMKRLNRVPQDGPGVGD